MFEIDPTLMAQFFAIALLVIKDLALGFSKRKNERKEIELGVLYDKFSNLEAQVATMSSAQKAILQGEDLILRAINNLTQAAKLSPIAKEYGNDLISKLSLIIKDVAYENVDELIEKAKEELRTEAAKRQIPEEKTEEVLNKTVEVITQIPDTIKKYVSAQE